MTGIVFREFIGMVDNTFGEEIASTLLTTINPGSDKSYTGAYNHQELIAMATALSEHTGIKTTELVHNFGKHLALVFLKKCPTFFCECKSTFEYLKKINDYLHVEIKKIYSDVKLPSCDYRDLSENELELTYESMCNFADLAHGFIEGCMEYFHESYQILREDIEFSGSTKIRFTLRRFIK